MEDDEGVYHDEVEIEDFEYDEDTDTYYYPCPCGDKFEISKVAYLRLGPDEYALMWYKLHIHIKPILLGGFTQW